VPVGYEVDLGVLAQYRHLLLAGLWVSLQLLLTAEVLGVVLGLAIGTGRLSRLRLLSLACGVWIDVFRGVPPLVQLFWFYYALPILTGLQLPAFWTGAVSLGLFAGAYMAEIFRAGIQSVHKGQVLAARALGMSWLQAMRDVVLPQAVRRMLPPLVSQSIDVFKATALASTITVPELMFQTYYATSQTFRSVEFYTASALLYLILAFPGVSYLRRLEVRARGV